MTEPRWLDESEAALWRGFLAARVAVDAAVERDLAGVGLSTADWQLLVPLSESPEDTLRARDLARVVGWDRSRLSHQLRRMEARGLLTRAECPTDARGTMVGLTPAGRALVVQAAPGHVATVRAVFVDVLDPDQAAALTAAFAAIRAAACPVEPTCDGD